MKTRDLALLNHSREKENQLLRQLILSNLNISNEYYDLLVHNCKLEKHFKRFPNGVLHNQNKLAGPLQLKLLLKNNNVYAWQKMGWIDGRLAAWRDG